MITPSFLLFKRLNRVFRYHSLTADRLVSEGARQSRRWKEFAVNRTAYQGARVPRVFVGEILAVAGTDDLSRWVVAKEPCRLQRRRGFGWRPILSLLAAPEAYEWTAGTEDRVCGRKDRDSMRRRAVSCEHRHCALAATLCLVPQIILQEGLELSEALECKIRSRFE